jgi:hypothetical protein
MSEKKGALQKIVDAVGEAVQEVAATVGLTDPVPEAPAPKSKSVRKAARKAAVAKDAEAQQTVRKARIARHRRTNP